MMNDTQYLSHIIHDVLAAATWLDHVIERLDQGHPDYDGAAQREAYERLATELSEFARYVSIDPRRTTREVILNALSAESAVTR